MLHARNLQDLAPLLQGDVGLVGGDALGGEAAGDQHRLGTDLRQDAESLEHLLQVDAAGAARGGIDVGHRLGGEQGLAQRFDVGDVGTRGAQPGCDADTDADQRRHRMRLHRLEALDHRLIVLHAVLHVDGNAIPAAARHDFRREAAWDRQPAVDAGLARLQPPLQHVYRHRLVSSPN